MKRVVLNLLVLAILAAIGWGIWFWMQDRQAKSNTLQLFGNVDLRQVDLAFNGNQRIAQVLVQEGDVVHKGQLLAMLDTGRLQPQLEVTEAQAQAQSEIVQRLHNGNRIEEIAQSRAQVEADQANSHNAHQQLDRLLKIQKTSGGQGISQQDMDNAQAAVDTADAKLNVSQKALDLEEIGPRREDIAQAEAMLRADIAQVVLMRQELDDAKLLAPVDSEVRSRMMEPGEMASPQTPVLSLAVLDPKWIRAYASEPDLARLRPGMPASVTVDGLPGQIIHGWVGFISPVAEFTPKTVQVEELRTSLVYEVRVFVNDPDNVLRLGMPATVTLIPGAPTTQNSTTEP